MRVTHVRDVPARPVGQAQGTTMQVLIPQGLGPNFAMRLFTMAPGGHMPPHTNTVEHEQYVVGGRARVGIGADEFEVETGSVLLIPAGVPHWYRSEGDEPFRFLCIVPNRPDEIRLAAPSSPSSSSC